MKFGKKLLSTVLAAGIAFSTCAVILPAVVSALEEPSVYELEDSGKWVNNNSKGEFDIYGNTMMLNGQEGQVYHSGKVIGANELVAFKARFEFNDPAGWIAFKLRSSKPNDQIWNNINTYYVLVTPTTFSLNKVKDGATIPLKDVANTQVTDGEYHDIQFGVINDTGTAAKIIMKVDGETVLDVTDNDRLEIDSYFSVNSYLDTTIELDVKPVEGGRVGGQVDRAYPTAALKPLSDDSKWFINQRIDPLPDQQFYTDLTAKDGKVTLNGMGAGSYKDYLSAHVFSFDVQLSSKTDDPVDGYTTIMFKKLDRDAYTGQKGYGLRITNTGRIYLVYCLGNTVDLFPGYKTNVDFSEKHNVTIEVVDKGNWNADFYIYIDGSSKPYKYSDTNYDSDFEPDSFFGILSDDMTLRTEISNIKIDGTEEEYASYSEVPPTYLEDYIYQEGRKLIHWEWRANYPIYKEVLIQDAAGNEVARVPFPQRTYELPSNHGYKKLYITAVNADGDKAQWRVVDLTESRSQYYAEEQGRIAVRETSGNAELYNTLTGEKFVVNGVNYVKLRYGDHSNFEGASDLMPGEYDQYSVETMFKLLKKNGMNTVRVFLSMGRAAGNPGLGGDYKKTMGIYIPYMENFIDFLKKAQKYGIYVLPTFGDNELPNNEYFQSLSNNAAPQDTFFTKEGLEAKIKLMTLVYEYVLNRDPSLINTMLALQTQNEFYFDAGQAPFNQTTGTYTFYANGQTYDMSSASERRELANAAVQHYFSEISKAIKALDPGMLISVGTFSMRVVGKTYEDDLGIFPITDGSKDSRYPLSATEMMACDIDFFDLHCYNAPGADGDGARNQDLDVENMKLNTAEGKAALKKTPIIMGEYGGFLQDQQDWESAKKWILDMRDAAMDNGYSGHMLWEFDSFCQNLCYSAMYDGGAFLKELSLFPPANVYDPNENDPGPGGNGDIPVDPPKSGVFAPVLAVTALLLGAMGVIFFSYKRRKRAK